MTIKKFGPLGLGAHLSYLFIILQENKSIGGVPKAPHRSWKWTQVSIKVFCSPYRMTCLPKQNFYKVCVST